MATKYKVSKFFDENGNDIGFALVGPESEMYHDDCLTSLAYGSGKYMALLAVHMMEGDGVGATFTDPPGKHLLDVMPMVMAESPSWAAYGS
jgi:hypothetical protein